MMTGVSDESAWLRRLFNHVYDHLTPVASHCSCTALHRAVLHALRQSDLPLAGRSRSPRPPLEYDLLTVKKLQEKFPSSFQVRLEDHGLKKTPSDPSGLTELPVVLLGVLSQNGEPGCHGELVIKDSTGAIVCEVALSDELLRLVGSPVLLMTWNFIHSTSKKIESYLEIQKMRSLVEAGPEGPTHDNILSVAQLQRQLRRKSGARKAKVNVYGSVVAVSELQRSDEHFHFQVILADCQNDDAQYIIIVQSSHLLYLSKLLPISETYLFTELRDMVMRKGKSNEERVLASSDKTQISVYSSVDLAGLLTDSPTPSAPPRKRMKMNNSCDWDIPGSFVSSLDLTCSSGQCAGEGKQRSQLQVGLQEPHPLIAYTGTVTRCVSQEFGVYELDNRVKLYLTHCQSLDRCRGLRCGATLELCNVHVMRISEPPWNQSSGFYCCSVSSVRVVKFSTLNSSLQGYYGRNKLASVAKKHLAMDVAWMVEVFLTLRRKHENDSKSCITLLEAICKLHGPPRAKLHGPTSFLSQSHSCPLMEFVDLSSRPQVPTISDFKAAIDQKVARGELHWLKGGRGSEVNSAAVEASPFLSHVSPARWSYTCLKSSDLPNIELLTGTLRGCGRTGRTELADSTAAIPIVPCIPLKPITADDCSTSLQATKDLMVHFGATILIDRFTICLERVSEEQNSKVSVYLHAKSCTFAVKSDRRILSSPDVPVDEGGTSVRRCLYLAVLHKNSLVAQRSSTGSSAPQLFTAQALVHTDLKVLQSNSASVETEASVSPGACPPLRIALEFSGPSLKWYSYVCNGCLYSLTSHRSPFPSLAELKANPCIAIGRDMEVQLLQSHHSGPGDSSPPVLDVSDLISKIFLPRFRFAESLHIDDSLSPGYDHLVSITGVVLEHGQHTNYEGIASNKCPLQGQGSSSGAERIVVLLIRGLEYPDTITMYVNVKKGIPLPIGLIPGTTATFYAFKGKTSKSGNIYCASCATSSIQVHSFVDTRSGLSQEADVNGVTPQMSKLPTSYLYDTMMNLLHGRLTRRVLCIRGKFASVQQVSLQFVCLTCHSIVSGGKCRGICSQTVPVLKAEGRLILDDGSGEGHVYVKDLLLQQALAATTSEWAALLSVVEQCGHVVYNRNAAYALRNDAHPPHGALSLQEKALQQLSHLATQPTLSRTVNVYCQPFVSVAELKDTIIGQRTYPVWVSSTLQYSTVALPRLQLKGLAIAPVNFHRECTKLLQLLTDGE